MGKNLQVHDAKLRMIKRLEHFDQNGYGKKREITQKGQVAYLSLNQEFHDNIETRLYDYQILV